MAESMADETQMIEHDRVHADSAWIPPDGFYIIEYRLFFHIGVDDRDWYHSD